MTLRDRIPVEPLSDERVTNIERRIVVGASDALQRPVLERPRWVGFAAAAAFAVVVGVVGWRVGSSRPTPEVAVAEPIRVDTRERTLLDIGDARITHDPNTAVVITRPAGGVLVDMTRGKVELQVDKRGARPALVVRAGDTDVVVVGTRFSVDYGDGTHPPLVVVTEGVVNVVRTNATFRVEANSAWTLERGVFAATELALNDVTTKVTGGTPPPEDDEGVATGDLALRNHQGTTPTGSAPTGERTGSAATPGSGSAERAKPIKVVQYTEDLHKALRAQPVTPAFDVGIDDPKLAIAEHYRLAANRGDEAARSLYSIAVLQLLKLRDPAKALATLDSYFSRFQHRSQHVDALWLKVRILCEQKFDDRCKNAAKNFADDGGDGPKAGIANQITGKYE